MMSSVNLSNWVARAAPWLAPLPTAWVVGLACYQVLGWPWPVALVAAVIIETLALATTETALELYRWNRSKRKADASAPAWLAWVSTVAGILAQSGLILALEARPVLLIFQVFSASAVLNLALRADHSARVALVAQEKAQAREERAQKAQAKVEAVVPVVHERSYEAFRLAQKARNGHGPMGAKEAMALFDVPRRTAYNWVEKYKKESV